MDLISDIFNLFIKFNNISDHRSARDQMDGEHEDVPESIKDYVLNRSGWADLGSLKNGKREDMRQALTELYELIRKSYTQRIEVNASVTNPSADLLVHVTTQEDGLKKYKHLLEIALHPSATQTEDSPLLDVEVRPATPGGLDLSKTRENTRFQHKGNPSSSDSNAHIPSIDPLHFKSFQGFEFYIIQFQPIADPAKFLLGFFSDRWDQIARAS